MDRNFLADTGQQRIKGFSFMWMTNTITTRILICLAMLTVPLQDLPAASCNCSLGCSLSFTNCCCCTGAPICHCGEGTEITTDSASGCESQSEKDACCIETQAAEPGSCSCGTNCHCGKQSQPVSPLVPSSDAKNPSEKLVSLSQLTVVTTLVDQPPKLGKPRCISASLVSLDRCISLCRFTL